MKRTLLTFSLASAVALACLLLAACGGSSTPTSSPTPAPTATLSSSDLTGLVLPVQTVTVGGVELDFDASESGPQTKAQVLDGSFDTQRDTAELDQYGWRAEQRQTFLISADTAPGVFVENNSVDLVDTADHAAQALPKRFTDLASDVGKSSTDSSGNTAKLISVTAFTPVGFEGAEGITASLEQGGSTIYLTEISFSRGPLLASVGIGSYDQSDQTTAVVTFAHQLDAQISTVVKS